MTKLIRAADARKLADESTVAINNWIDAAVAPVVKEAAEKGLHECFVLIEAIPTWQRPEPSATVKAATHVIRELGYTITYNKYGDEYVPRGMQNDDGTGEKYRHFGLIISW